MSSGEEKPEDGSGEPNPPSKVPEEEAKTEENSCEESKPTVKLEEAQTKKECDSEESKTSPKKVEDRVKEVGNIPSGQEKVRYFPLVMLVFLYHFLVTDAMFKLIGFISFSYRTWLRTLCCFFWYLCFNRSAWTDPNNQTVPLGFTPATQPPFLFPKNTCSLDSQEDNRWCDPTEGIVFPDFKMIVYLFYQAIVSGIMSVILLVWSNLKAVGSVISTSLFITGGVATSFIITIAFTIFLIRRIPTVIDKLKLLSEGISTFILKMKRKKASSPHTQDSASQSENQQGKAGVSNASKDASKLKAANTAKAADTMPPSVKSLVQRIKRLIDPFDFDDFDKDTNTPASNASKIKLSDYKGATEAKQELELVVDFLKNPQKYHELGARLPRGVLLYGPPGTGKTLFARALAGEADVAFIHKCASEFRSMFVGSGARNIRNLFATARKKSPCILFIDEIDSISKRTSSDHHPYANQAINQILYEMDGFVQNDANIIVVAATNRLDNIDEALLRPGRFDKVVRVDLPDLKARKEILEFYFQRLKKVGEMDAAFIASKTEDYSGAELEAVVNAAAIVAVREAAAQVEQKHLEQAIEDRRKSGEKMKEYDSSSYKPSSRKAIAHMYN